MSLTVCEFVVYNEAHLFVKTYCLDSRVMVTFTRTEYKEAAAFIRTKTDRPIHVGFVLGSGVGALADLVEDPVTVSYQDIPHFPQSTVHGHRGELVIGQLFGVNAVVLRGRSHFYEGYSMQQITFPIRMMHELGVHTVVLTNAAGGVNPAYKTGDIMVINDHINFIGLAGNNPLIGPNDETLGARFPSMTQAYDQRLRQQVLQIAAEHAIPAHQGVYCAVSGPMFETPAEVRMVRVLGADAVGMSTVHETIVARHMNMKVLALSGITNEAVDAIDTDLQTTHEEVLDAALVIVPRMTTLIRGVAEILK